ncbi:MAG: hypothetical protein CR997_04095 [Acidobacteria bacterium]|nr:MAG: hypothetical protein CR997_04095 [Acidobacteriota bacterium]
MLLFYLCTALISTLSSGLRLSGFPVPFREFLLKSGHWSCIQNGAAQKKNNEIDHFLSEIFYSFYKNSLCSLRKNDR